MKAGLVFDSSNLYQHIFHSPDEFMQEELQEFVWSSEFGPGSPQQLERLSTLLQALKGAVLKTPSPPKGTFGIYKTTLFQDIILGDVSSFST